MADMSDPKPGAPDKYEPRFCQMLIDHMREGLSIHAFGGVVLVSRQTLYNWLDKYPEFKEAKEIGESLSLLFWEKMGRSGAMTVVDREKGIKRSLNAGVWSMNMKNRFGWRERQPEERDDIKVTVTNEVTVDKTDLEDRIKQLKNDNEE